MSGRISRKVDVGRLARAVQRAGIDPRVWCAIAYVTSDAPVVSDEGVFVEVHLPAYDLDLPARVAGIYAGPGFGLYAPPGKDDEVQVLVPGGEWDHGLVLGPRMWSASDPPPQAAIDHPADFVLVAKADANVRISVQGGGDVILNGGSLKVARDTDDVDCGAYVFVPGTGDASLTWVPPGAPAMPGMVAVAGKISGGADHVKA